MQVITPDLIKNKKVLLRLDIDVPIRKGIGGSLQVTEDFRLRAGLLTLKMCLENATQVIAMGHIGRPEGKVVPEFSVEPIRVWLEEQGLSSHLTSGKLKILENLRFDPREEACDVGYAEELAQMGDIYVNEAFASYNPAVSTTVLPTLLPHACGLHFAEEVRVLTGVRNNPKKPFIAIMGGAKVKDKLPVIEVFANSADAVLVGGKLVSEIRRHEGDPSLIAQDDNLGLDILPKLSNVMIGKLTEDGFDIAQETILSWKNLIMNAKMIVWNGPLGKFEDPKNSATCEIAKMVLSSGAEIIIGGGDIIAALGQYGLLNEAESKAFVSTGGGAMLKFLVAGTLPTIEVLSK